MSFQTPSPQLIAASREEGAAFDLFNAACAEFKALVAANRGVDSEKARELLHTRSDAWLDCYATTIAIGRRDIDRGLAP